MVAISRNHLQRHCVKGFRIRSYSGPHFPAFGPEYGEIPYSVRMRENANQKNCKIDHFWHIENLQPIFCSVFSRIRNAHWFRPHSQCSNILIFNPNFHEVITWIVTVFCDVFIENICKLITSWSSLITFKKRPKEKSDFTNSHFKILKIHKKLLRNFSVDKWNLIGF